jgi:hypothetical protein
MTFLEAIKTELPLCRKNKSFGYSSTYVFGNDHYTDIVRGTFIDPLFFLEYIILTKEDIMAKDWIVKRD